MRKVSGVLAAIVLVISTANVSHAENTEWKNLTIAQKGQFFQRYLAFSLIFTEDELEETNHFPYRGIGVFTRTAATGKNSSVVLVRGFLDDSPAEKAGLRLEDLIESVNGKPVSTAQEFASLVKESGSDVQLRVERSNSKEMFLTIVCKKAMVGRSYGEYWNAKNPEWQAELKDIKATIQIYQLQVSWALAENDADCLDQLYSDTDRDFVNALDRILKERKLDY